MNTRASDLAGIVTDSIEQQAQLDARVADTVSYRICKTIARTGVNFPAACAATTGKKSSASRVQAKSSHDTTAWY